MDANGSLGFISQTINILQIQKKKKQTPLETCA